MRTDDYTSEAICKSMGMPSFEHDDACKHAVEAIRLLLKPSFRPEICLTFADGKVSVICARFMIWHQFEPSPMLADRAEGVLSVGEFADLVSSMTPLTHPDAVPGIVIDGMPSEFLHFRRGAVALKAGGNAGCKGDFSNFVALAIATARSGVSNPYCRNALAEAAEYIGQRLPRDAEPARKPAVETMVLGPEEDRAQLLAALRRHSGG